MSKRLSFTLLLLFILSLGSGGLCDGFTNDYPAIDGAAKSVVLLEVYDEDDVLISTGSGFCAFDVHTLVTNYHVIEDAHSILAYTDDGDAFYIESIYAAQEERDLALLKVFAPSGVLPLPVADTSSLLRAQPVLAIGSPQGYHNTVSTGNISALRTEEGYREIQFTAPISSGSSGGALFNDSGEVIGITYATLVEGQNLNYAIDIAYACALYESSCRQSAVSLSRFQKGEHFASPLRSVFSSDILPLSPPEWDACFVDNDGVHLSWLPVEGAESYRLYTSESENGIYMYLSTVWKDTSCLVPVNDATCYYRLRAIQGSKLSDFSKTIYPFE